MNSLLRLLWSGCGWNGCCAWPVAGCWWPAVPAFASAGADRLASPASL